jgi:hypothetical protein
MSVNASYVLLVLLIAPHPNPPAVQWRVCASRLRCCGGRPAETASCAACSCQPYRRSVAVAAFKSDIDIFSTL